MIEKACTSLRLWFEKRIGITTLYDGVRIETEIGSEMYKFEPRS